MMDALWRAAIRHRSAGKLIVLTYHRVTERPDPLFPEELDESRFEWQMRLVARHFRVLPLPEAVEALQAGTLPRGALCITFDDGYANNYRVAWPILERLGLPATFFIATAFLDGGRMWNDTVIEALRATSKARIELPDGTTADVATPAQRRAAIDRAIDSIKYLPPPERARHCERIAAAAEAALPSDLMMTSEMVASLAAAGMDIGGHTHSHPILSRLSADDAEHEVRLGIGRLREITGRPVRSFAYPNGRPDVDYTQRDAAIVRRADLALAVTTARGVNDRTTDRFQLGRFAPWDRTSARFMLRMLEAYGWSAEPARREALEEALSDA